MGTKVSSSGHDHKIKATCISFEGAEKENGMIKNGPIRCEGKIKVAHVIFNDSVSRTIPHCIITRGNKCGGI